VLIQVAEDEAVAEGIGDAHIAAPGLFDDAGPRVLKVGSWKLEVKS
jgi:hypothetical protein